MKARDRIAEILEGITERQLWTGAEYELADALIAAGVVFSEEKVVVPYQYERCGKSGQSYSLKCGRCDKTIQSKWSYCPFCGVKIKAVEDERE